MKQTQRMFQLMGTKRTGIKLDDATWRAIDWIAEQDGKSWQEWCSEAIFNAGANENMVASVRSAVIEAMLIETVGGERRASALAAMERHPLMKDSAMLGDKDFQMVMDGATVYGSSDFISFKVHFGRDQYGQDSVWIENALKDCPHFAFLIPSNK